jgi:hypothetical protein
MALNFSLTMFALTFLAEQWQTSAKGLSAILDQWGSENKEIKDDRWLAYITNNYTSKLRTSQPSRNGGKRKRQTL